MIKSSEIKLYREYLGLSLREIKELGRFPYSIQYLSSIENGGVYLSTKIIRETVAAITKAFDKKYDDETMKKLQKIERKIQQLI